MEEQRRGCVESDRTVTVGIASSRDKFERMWAEMKDSLVFLSRNCVWRGENNNVVIFRLYLRETVPLELSEG